MWLKVLKERIQVSTFEEKNILKIYHYVYFKSFYLIFNALKLSKFKL